jgi:hypothetical protein
MPTPAGDRRTAELVAAGNTVAEGRTFFARGARITYAEAKGLLILEGDGRSDAELMRQEQVGGPRTQIPAQKIYFLPKTRQFKIEGARGLQIDQVPSRLPGGGRPSAPGGLPGKTSR